MNRAPSPNFDDRATDLRYIVLHYTGMKTAQAALDRMCDPKTKVSAHYMIDEDGTPYQLVEEDKRAWHAGVSFWRGETDINSASIGIELVNPGHEFGYRPFPKAQIDALKALIKDIMSRHGLPADCLLAHSDVAPSRRFDPGVLFPWQELAQEGLGLWPAPTQEDMTPLQPHEVELLLRKVGYSCELDCEVEKVTARVGFLRHYHPARVELGFDEESGARLQALARLLP